MSLATLAEVKEFLGITGTSLDALIGHLITRMEKAISNYCNRVFEAANYIEQYDGAKFNGGVLILKNFPVISVTTLKEDSGRTFAAGTEIDSTDYVIYKEEGVIQLDDDEFEEGLQTVQVSYRAGYGPIPADLSQCCIDMVSYKLEDRKTGGGSITSRRLADAAISYGTGGGGGAILIAGGVYVPKSAVMTLERYRTRKLYVL